MTLLLQILSLSYEVNKEVQLLEDHLMSRLITWSLAVPCFTEPECEVAAAVHEPQPSQPCHRVTLTCILLVEEQNMRRTPPLITR